MDLLRVLTPTEVKGTYEVTGEWSVRVRLSRCVGVVSECASVDVACGAELSRYHEIDFRDGTLVLLGSLRASLLNHPDNSGMAECVSCNRIFVTSESAALHVMAALLHLFVLGRVPMFVVRSSGLASICFCEEPSLFKPLSGSAFTLTRLQLSVLRGRLIDVSDSMALRAIHSDELVRRLYTCRVPIRCVCCSQYAADQSEKVTHVYTMIKGLVTSGFDVSCVVSSNPFTFVSRVYLSAPMVRS